jgi:hypothetical protein
MRITFAEIFESRISAKINAINNESTSFPPFVIPWRELASYEKYLEIEIPPYNFHKEDVPKICLLSTIHGVRYNFTLSTRRIGDVTELVEITLLLIAAFTSVESTLF